MPAAGLCCTSPAPPSPSLQIYNEEVNDLLNEEKQNLSIKMDQDNGIMVAGLSEVLVYSKQDVMRLIAAGDSKRHIGETKMNDKSSRSHSIFKMVRIDHLR